MSVAGAYISRLAHLVAGGATSARQCHKRLGFQTPNTCRRDPHSEVNTRLSHGSIRLSPDALKMPRLRNPLPGCGNDNVCWGTTVGDECRILEFLISVAASCGICAAVYVARRPQNEMIVINEERPQAYGVASRNRCVVLRALRSDDRNRCVPGRCM